jgi:hypothetical protein
MVFSNDGPCYSVLLFIIYIYYISYILLYIYFYVSFLRKLHVGRDIVQDYVFLSIKEVFIWEWLYNSPLQGLMYKEFFFFKYRSVHTTLNSQIN